jgi:hypothetical protein
VASGPEASAVQDRLDHAALEERQAREALACGAFLFGGDHEVLGRLDQAGPELVAVLELVLLEAFVRLRLRSACRPFVSRAARFFSPTRILRMACFIRGQACVANEARDGSYVEAAFTMASQAAA